MPSIIKKQFAEVKYFFKSALDKIQGKTPHKYAGKYLIEPHFGGLYLKKVIQGDEEQFVFKSHYKGAEMFTSRQANEIIRIYKKAGKHKTRFAIVKKRVTIILEEAARQKQEKEENEAAQIGIVKKETSDFTLINLDMLKNRPINGDIFNNKDN